MSFINYFLAFGIFQGLFLIGLIFFLRKNHKVNAFLLGIIFCLTFRLGEFFLMRIGFYSLYPQIIYVSIPLLLVIGPLSYLYLKSILYKDFSVSLREKVIHIIPFLLFITLMIPFYTSNGEQKLHYISLSKIGQISAIQTFYFIMFFLQFNSYLVINIKLLKKYGILFKAERSDSSFIKVEWIKKLLLSIMLFSITYSLAYFSLFINYKYHLYFELFVYVSVVIALHLMFIYFIKYILGEFKFPKIKKTKYQTSNLNSEQSVQILNRLKKIMLEKKPYLDTDLRINHLAKLLDVPAPYISQVLNEIEKKNFYDFVNYYRIERAKQLMLDSNYKQYTLMAVAYDSGFNNKTTFNRAFKKHLGITPTEFVKQSKIS